MIWEVSAKTQNLLLLWHFQAQSCLIKEESGCTLGASFMGGGDRVGHVFTTWWMRVFHKFWASPVWGANIGDEICAGWPLNVIAGKLSDLSLLCKHLGHGAFWFQTTGFQRQQYLLWGPRDLLTLLQLACKAAVILFLRYFWDHCLSFKYSYQLSWKLVAPEYTEGRERLKWKKMSRAWSLSVWDVSQLQWGSCLAGEVLAGSSPELSKSMCKALKGHWFRLICSRVAMCCGVVLEALLWAWVTGGKLSAELWASTWVWGRANIPFVQAKHVNQFELFFFF